MIDHVVDQIEINVSQRLIDVDVLFIVAHVIQI